MDIRAIRTDELEKAINLIWDTFLEFEAPDYSELGVETFRAFISNDAILKELEFFGAFEDGILKGVIATLGERKHICCFFVSAKYHRQGIGKKLWEYIKANSSCSEITVNSSPFAVEIYHKLGFEDTDTEQITDGIIYTPMRFIKQTAD